MKPYTPSRRLLNKRGVRAAVARLLDCERRCETPAEKDIYDLARWAEHVLPRKTNRKGQR